MSNNDSIPQKQCPKCKLFFPATNEYFHKNSARKSGLRSRCKSCNNADANQYYHENADDVKSRAYDRYWSDPEYARELRRDTYWRNPDKHRASSRRYRINNPNRWNEWAEPQKERLLDAKREWRRNNPELVKHYKSTSQRRHPEGLRRRVKRWALKNPQKLRTYTLNRVARVRNAEGTHTDIDIQRIYDEQEGRCTYCGISVYFEVPFDVHVDHIHPLIRGGTNWPDNLAIACQHCNDSKGSKTLDEWIAVRGW